MVNSVVDGFIVKISLAVVSLVDETFPDVWDGVVVLSVEVVLNAEEVVSLTKEYYISRIKIIIIELDEFFWVMIRCLKLIKSNIILRHVFGSQTPQLSILNITPLL